MKAGTEVMLRRGESIRRREDSGVSRRYLGTQMSSIISGVTRQKFTKFLYDMGTSSPLLMSTFR